MDAKTQAFFQRNYLWRPMLLPEHRLGTAAAARAAMTEEEPVAAPSEERREEMERLLCEAMRQGEPLRIRVRKGKRGEWIECIPVGAGKRLRIRQGEYEREIPLSDILDVEE
ncbi:hypothetical protein GTO91_15855 [Heliobacterium undosum]|uniref:YolD-like family protein n=1 Tax=Heliomicrobium undosum TaxID=121734 RepID=A0A845L3I6_9FIRM|nr:hypothetical protein [Heliomicrobium undosum]MZP31182.1 hypothetical protein [Heliomicrobium undosum]